MKRTIEPCIKRLMMKHGIKEPVARLYFETFLGGRR